MVLMCRGVLPDGHRTLRDGAWFPWLNRIPVVYERDILDDMADDRRPVRYPEVDIAVGMVVEDRSSGFCGDVVKWSIEAVTLRDRKQHQRHFALEAGRVPARGAPGDAAPPGRRPGDRTRGHGVGVDRRRTGRGRGSPRPAGSRSRAAMTPSWSSTSGATTCGTSASSWSRSTASTTWPARWLTSGRAGAPARGARRPLVGARRSPARGLGATRTCRHGPPVRRRVGRDPAPCPRPRGLARHPPGRGRGRRACARPRRRPAGFWPQLRNQVSTYADLRPELVGAVERLIDFVCVS